VTTGARFTDATPFEQRDILRERRADGVLSTRISIGADLGIGQRRTAIVQLRLLAFDGTLAWARRPLIPEPASSMATHQTWRRPSIPVAIGSVVEVELCFEHGADLGDLMYRGIERARGRLGAIQAQHVIVILVFEPKYSAGLLLL
jgi:hypothetical protein